MSVEMNGNCRSCGETNWVYFERKEKYHEELCLNRDCRWFYTEVDGEVESDWVMPLDEWLERDKVIEYLSDD